ncbi:LLM class flavin-dependent oxidoreductase [Actinomadura madurae]|uniref:LLM class flavin-dependent oxidoreductase n=1 Tax=Actinomadura madurae TaxID=1993 RepID=UPI0020D239C0|nr:LLM class flavin-dependent oxidoreductase [Actinomadura madurae]MCQ0016600.1 LLM class flavin-dependent oxidoreductase [Actinomadura madurae]
MKFSYAMLPDYPVAESLASIKLADELGFHAVYAADEPWHKDLWLLFAAAAANTSQIRLGPSVSAVTLREPSLIAQAAATLDELTGGRAEVVLGSGNFGVLAQYKIDWAKTKPLTRVKEAVAVVRTLLDEGAITRDGEFYSYDGLFTFARPVQEHLPVKIGAMRGPKSFEAAGELSDGVHHALSYSRGAYEYAVEHFRAGAERARQGLAVARHRRLGGVRGRPRLHRGQGGGPQHGRPVRLGDAAEQLQRNGVDPADMAPIIDAIGGGDLAKAIELTTPEITEKLSLAGTPDEVRAKIESDIAPTGVNHMICAITDPGLVKSFTGRDLTGVPDVDGQLRLIHEHLMPAFK